MLGLGGLYGIYVPEFCFSQTLQEWLLYKSCEDHVTFFTHVLRITVGWSDGFFTRLLPCKHFQKIAIIQAAKLFKKNDRRITKATDGKQETTLEKKPPLRAENLLELGFPLPYRISQFHSNLACSRYNYRGAMVLLTLKLLNS